MPAEIVKSTDDQGNEKMQIAGIASTTDEDTDEEILLPKGFDLSYFTESGFVNWHHRQKDKPSAIIGEPSAAKILKGGKEMHVVCDLYNTPLAQEVYALGKVLESQSTSGRRLGFSIEGKVLERDKNNPRIVTKAAITGCAITYQPKNKATIAQIVKADGSTPDNDLEPDMDGLLEDLKLMKAAGASSEEILKACGEMDMKKDVSADLDKQNFESGDEEDKVEDDEEDKEEEVEKTLDAGSASGQAIAPASVDDKLKDNRPGFLSKAHIEGYLLASGIEVPSDDFINFVLKVKNHDTMATQNNDATTITKADMDAALGLLEKAKAYKAEEEPDELEPGEDDDDDEKDEKEEKVEKAFGADQLGSARIQDANFTIEKAVRDLATNYSTGFGAVETLLKGFQSELEKSREETALLRAKVEELETAPAAGRKALTRLSPAQPIEKAFDLADADNGISKAGNAKALSVSRQKAAICTELEKLAFPENGFNQVMAKAMTVFESSSQLDPMAVEALRKQGFEIIA